MTNLSPKKTIVDLEVQTTLVDIAEHKTQTDLYDDAWKQKAQELKAENKTLRLQTKATDALIVKL